MAKARTAAEYSFDVKGTSPVQEGTFSGKVYIKGTKLRQDAVAGGQNVVMIVDTATKVAYMMIPDQKTAVKADFSQVVTQAPNPTEQVTRLPADAKFVGNETIDGKPAAVYETTTPEGPSRFAIWTERGLPLRVETTTLQGKATVEFTNYQFTPQPDSLFELPPGTQILDLPSALPGAPGGLPLPTPRN